MSTDFDTTVRLALYQEFVTTTAAPTAAGLAARMRCSAEEVGAALERLAAAKAIVFATGRPNCSGEGSHSLRGAGEALVGEHRLHVKDNVALPGGGAH